MKVRMPETIGGRLRFLRMLKGIQQNHLAQLLGVAAPIVSKWETGSTIPETKNIIALSDFYGVTTDFILKGDTNEE